MRKLFFFFLTLILSSLVLLGCSDRYDEGYTSGYDEGYTSGYDEGYSGGYNVGYLESKPPIMIEPILPKATNYTIQDLFIYKNIDWSERTAGFSFYFTGEIENKTGARYSLAKFEITLYNANRRNP